ncbi:MAG: YncE family protein, partial [Gaiellales bacterium]
MSRRTPVALLAAGVAGLALGAPVAGAYTQISTPLGFNPTAVAVSPSGDTAIPIGSVVGRVAIPSLVAEADYVNAADTYSGVAYRPDGREAYVTSSGSDNITVIDVPSGQPSSAGLASTPVCTSQTDVAVNAAGTRLAIACDTAGSNNGIVQLIATSTFEVLNRDSPAPLPFEPRSVVLAPDGSRAYVTAANESKLAIVTLPGGGVTDHTLPGVSLDLAINPAGTYLYIPTQDGTGAAAVAKVLVDGFSTTDTVSLPAGSAPAG